MWKISCKWRFNKIKTNREIGLSPINEKNYEYFYKDNSNRKSVLIKYNDTKTIYAICNFLNAPKEFERIRWDKKDKKFKKEFYHEIIHKYNGLMNLVDLSNQLISYYELNRKTVKWWKKIFFNLIDNYIWLLKNVFHIV